MVKSESQALKRSVRLSGRESELRRQIYKRRTEERLREAGIRVERGADVKEGTKVCHEQAHGDPANQFAPTEVEGNFTVHGGDGLVIIDIDVPLDELPDWVRDLPETFIVRSPHGGYHLYYVVEDDADLSNTKMEWGSIRYGWYGVGPGSIIDHERCDDGKGGCPGEGVGWYTIDCDKQIATLTDDHLDRLRDACGSSTDDGEGGAEQYGGGKITLPDSDLADPGEELLCSEMPRKSKGLFMEDMMDLLRGGTGSYDLRRDNDPDSIDQSAADSYALDGLNGVFLFCGEDEDNARRLALAVFKRYCLENKYDKTGNLRKWLRKGEAYLQEQMDAVQREFDLGEWHRWRRREYEGGFDPDEHQPWADPAKDGNYSDVRNDLTLAVIQVCYGRDPENVAELYGLDLSSLPPTSCGEITPVPSGGVSERESPYWKPKEVRKLLVEVNGGSESSYRTILKRLRRDGLLKLACIKEGVDYRVYPADYPDPPDACYIQVGGEKRDPEPVMVDGDDLGIDVPGA